MPRDRDPDMTILKQEAPRVADLIGVSLGSHSAVYSERDAILYALAVGGQAEELDLVYERRLQVLSTFALTLGLWSVEAAGRLGAYDPVRTLHVTQRLRMHDYLAPSGRVDMEARIAAVWDKGAAALLEVLVSSISFEATYGIWIPEAGGFAGERGPSSDRWQPADQPDIRLKMTTSKAQAVLYRLTGDLHPLHVDPVVAREAGYDRPILHGLYLIGASSLALARSLAADPWDLSELSVRIAAPLYPGASFEILGWRPRSTGPLAFSAVASETELLRAGLIAFRGGSKLNAGFVSRTSPCTTCE